MNPAGIGRFSRPCGTLDEDWREVACQPIIGLEYFLEHDKVLGESSVK